MDGRLVVNASPVDSAAYCFEGQRLFLKGNSQQCLKRRHRRLTSIEAKNKLIQIGRKILRLNAMMRSVQPSPRQRHKGDGPLEPYHPVCVSSGLEQSDDDHGCVQSGDDLCL